MSAGLAKGAKLGPDRPTEISQARSTRPFLLNVQRVLGQAQIQKRLRGELALSPLPPVTTFSLNA